jgi:hypothetical protein
MRNATLLVILLLAPSLLAGQGARPSLTPGRYTVHLREGSGAGRFDRTILDFREDGGLLWIEAEEIWQVMEWKVRADTLEINDGPGCPFAPIGLYRLVSWKEGIAFDLIADGCAGRANSATAVYVRQAVPPPATSPSH